MLTEYATRGLKAGLVAGVVFGVFVALVGNPLVGLADGFSHGHEHGESAHDGTIVSEAVTNVVSVGAGVLWGLLAGILAFGIAYYFLEPVVPGGPDVRSYLFGAAGFVTASGAPWLVLPPQPAGVEQALATDVRLFWYAVMMIAGGGVCGLSGYAYTRIRRDSGQPLALVGAALPFGLLAVPVLLAPSNAIEGATSEFLVASYRGVVVFGQVLFWFVLASAHALFVRRDRDEEFSDRERTALAEPHSSVSGDR